MRDQGFTLIEVLIAVFLLIFSLGALGSFFVYNWRIYQYQWQQAQAIEEAKRGIEKMAQEIRQARQGEDGSYPIEKAGDKEFIFFADVDKDGKVEKVRYFLGNVSKGTEIKECVTFSDGGTCSVIFSDFFQGKLQKAKLKVFVEGDFGWSREYADIFAEGHYLGRVCQSGCSDCAGTWQGETSFDVTFLAQDNYLEVLADASFYVNDFCDWQEPNHAMKARFELIWEAEIFGGENELKKGIIEPIGNPPQYSGEEKIEIVTKYVINTPPIFEYYDEKGNKIEEYPARLIETKVMRIYLIVDVDQNKPPPPFELETSVKLRNL